MKILKCNDVPYKLIGCGSSSLRSLQVKCTDFGHTKEIMYQKNVSDGGQFDVLKLSKDDYIVKSTGEVKQYKHSEVRTDNIDNLRRTFKKIRNLINNNFFGGDNELMFTGTYRENMTDSKRLYDDFRKFMMKVKYKYGHVEYLSIVEPQARGAWHCHVLLKFMDVQKIYIPNSEIADLWGQGFVTVRRLRKDVDNLGAYLSAYLGDIEVNAYNEEVIKEYTSSAKVVEYKEIEVDGQKKKFVKGGRLHLYPSGMNIYRKSRGIKEPKIETVDYWDIDDIQDLKPSYVSAVSICDDDNNELNNIIYEVYKIESKRIN